MSSTTLYRLSGISLFIGSLLLIIGDIPGFFAGDNQASTIAIVSSLIRLIGAMLIALGLPGMYARVAGRVGMLGLIGFTCTFFFILIGMASETILAFVFPFLAAHGLLGATSGPPPLGLLIFFFVGDLLALVGGILLGVTVMRAAALPRWAGLLLIVGGLLYAVGSVLRLPIAEVGLILFAAGLAWLAVGMWSKQLATGEVAHPPTGVRA
jgi:hypothetical protein